MIANELSYDPWQFYRGKAKPVSATSGIAWSDYERMGTIKAGEGLAKRRWIPAFAFDDAKLRAVLLKIGQRHVGLGCEITDWQEVNRQATEASFRKSSEHLPAHQKWTVESHQRAVRRAGSFLAMYAAVAFHYWRRAGDSVSVADTLGLTPQLVRLFSVRMVEVAKTLGFETYAPHPTAGKKKGKRAAEARRASLRRRLYGSPVFDEKVHCFRCKIERIAPGQKWHCECCAAKRREEHRLKRGRENRAKRKAAEALEAAQPRKRKEYRPKPKSEWKYRNHYSPKGYTRKHFAPGTDETTHCWVCKVNPKSPRYKWWCEGCGEKHRITERERNRRLRAEERRAA